MDAAQDTQKLDYRYLIQNQNNYDESLQKREQVIEYDYKIVSFRIGDEYYGINIMNVNSILKHEKFTLVPNVLDFVIGVFSLRGEILPVIDVAKMFRLKSTEEKNTLKSIIIIKVENLLIGLVVDQIQHVIPLNSRSIQPPSPLLGTINERYIEGVVEVKNRLYVILDTDAIFSDKEKTKKEILPQSSDLSEEFFTFFNNQMEEFCGIHIHGFNKPYVRTIFNDFIKDKNLSEMPKISREIANNLLTRIVSAHTGKFWQHPYTDNFIDAIKPQLNRNYTEEIQILDIGCSNGHEPLSIYFLLQQNFQDRNIKMIAADSNLLSVSNASRMEETSSLIPSWIDKKRYFINVTGDSFKIKKEITDDIYFEFHNAANVNTYKKSFDLVIARDLSFYMKESEYKKFVTDITGKIRTGGIFIIGDHEIINEPQFEKGTVESINYYIKK